MQMTPKSHIFDNCYESYWQNEEQEQNDIYKMSQNTSTQSQYEHLIQTNQNLTCSISLMSKQLELLKRMQKDKCEQNNKIKQKLTVKREQFTNSQRHVQAQALKNSKLANGLKLLQSKKEEMNQKEQQSRDRRISAQQNKNTKYQQYQQLQIIYKDLIRRIKDKDGVISVADVALDLNKQLREQIQEIEGCIIEEKSYRDNADNFRRERYSRIKGLNQKIQSLNKEEEHLKSQIQLFQRTKQQCQNQRDKIVTKTSEQTELLERLQEMKGMVILKRSELNEVDSTYRQLCIDENKLKKEVFLQAQCEQQRRKYRQSLKIEQKNSALKKQKISGVSTGKKQLNGQITMRTDGKGQNKLEDWIKRYESIRNK